MMNNGESEFDRYCSQIIKDGDEFVVYVFEHDQATDYRRMAFDDPEIASKFRQGAEPLTEIQQKIVDDLLNPTSFLDKMIQSEQAVKSTISKKVDDKSVVDKANSLLTDPPDLMFGISVEEFEKKFTEAKKKFKKKRAKFEVTAKAALLEAAKLFLGESSTQAYVKYKLELNQSGLGSIMYQIYTMEETLHALSARIKVAGAHLASRDVEVMTSLQRIILDAQKFQHEYLISVEQTMKDLKEDYDLLNTGKDKDKSEENVFFFRGGKDFLRQLGEISKMNSMKDFVPSASKNIKINPDANVQDVQYEEATKELAVGDNAKRDPFAGYEGVPKKQKKAREEEEEEDEDGHNANDFEF